MKYIKQLSAEIQEEIKNKLIAAGIEGEDLEIAMDSKIDDLEEILR